jgi:hypothetical protein
MPHFAGHGRNSRKICCDQAAKKPPRLMTYIPRPAKPKIPIAIRANPIVRDEAPDGGSGAVRLGPSPSSLGTPVRSTALLGDPLGLLTPAVGELAELGFALGKPSNTGAGSPTGSPVVG